MKKLSFVIVLTIAFIICISVGYNVDSFANDDSGEVTLSGKDKETIKTLIEEINSAAQSGDEQLVSKLLLNAIKRNPQIAGKIVETFASSQTKQATATNPEPLDIQAIINNIIANLQQQKGNDTLVAAILNSYNPAAGVVNSAENKVNYSESKNKGVFKPYLPPSLPPAGQVGGGNALPKENPNQTSPH